jgi:hypothetical protein
MPIDFGCALPLGYKPVPANAPSMNARYVTQSWRKLHVKGFGAKKQVGKKEGIGSAKPEGSYNENNLFSFTEG